MTLNDMKPGQKATIKRVEAGAEGVLRLMVLGLVEGAQVQHHSSAIGSDPMEIRVHGASVSVRRQQARAFEITGLNNGE